MNRIYKFRAGLLIAAVAIIVATGKLRADSTGTCSGQTITIPFNDVPGGNVFFCSIAEAFFSGLANGTTSTTYSPSANVTRDQMAAFVTRTLDQSLRRGSQRAAIKKFWVGTSPGFGIFIGDNPRMCECDGEDVWVANAGDDTVSRVRASDGTVLDTWTDAFQAFGVLVVHQRIYVTGKTTPPKVYVLNAHFSGSVGVLTSTIGAEPEGIAFDGQNIWTANASGSVSRIAVNGITTNFTTGFSSPRGILYDGSNIWVTDFGDDSLKKLSAAGSILLTVPVGAGPRLPVYDGVNIWVPNQTASTISVVRAATGQVVATISTAGIVDTPLSAAFDGERVFVVGDGGNGALFKATDLTLIVTRDISQSGSPPFGSCSDGISFFFTIPASDRLEAF